MSGVDKTASSVLVCDMCGSPVRVDADSFIGMVFWDKDGDVVIGCNGAKCHPDHDWCQELDAFACHESAFRELVRITNLYDIGLSGRTRLIDVAWAATELATPSHRARAYNLMCRRMEIGL